MSRFGFCANCGCYTVDGIIRQSKDGVVEVVCCKCLAAEQAMGKLVAACPVYSNSNCSIHTGNKEV